MTLSIVAFETQLAEIWDEFCLNSVNATLLHTRRFLSYHGTRLNDCSIMIYSDGVLVGLLSASESPLDPSVVVSHPGATYGGVIHQSKLRGKLMIEAFSLIREYYAALGYVALHYKAIPYIYATLPSQDDIYALFRLNAQRIRCELSSTIDLNNRGLVSKRRQRSLKKSKNLVELSTNQDLLPDFWNILSDNLERKHSAKPVHSLEEMAVLKQRFPSEIFIRCGLLNGIVHCGVLFFKSSFVWHAQYIAASESAYQVSALDMVFDSSIIEAKKYNARYFDFGTSNEQSGLVLNDSLYRFKTEFGGGGVAYECYELSW